MQIHPINDFSSYVDSPVWDKVARIIAERHTLALGPIVRVGGTENIVFFLGNEHILKIYTPLRNGFHREKTALEFAEGKSKLPVPRIRHGGEIEGYEYLILSRLPGETFRRDKWLTISGKSQVRIVSDLAAALRDLHAHDPSEIHFSWKEFMQIQMQSAIDKQAAAGGNPEWLEALPRFLDDNFDLLPTSFEPAFLHGDIHFGNLTMSPGVAGPDISGLFDFADSLVGFHEYEFVAIGVLMLQGQGELQRQFFKSYGYPDSQLDEGFRRRLMLLTILYECSSLKRYAERLRPDAVYLTLNELERAIWNFC